MGRKERGVQDTVIKMEVEFFQFIDEQINNLNEDSVF